MYSINLRYLGYIFNISSNISSTQNYYIIKGGYTANKAGDAS